MTFDINTAILKATSCICTRCQKCFLGYWFVLIFRDRINIPYVMLRDFLKK